jgi:hypothetical protein
MPSFAASIALPRSTASAMPRHKLTMLDTVDSAADNSVFYVDTDGASVGNRTTRARSTGWSVAHVHMESSKQCSEGDAAVCDDMYECPYAVVTKPGARLQQSQAGHSCVAAVCPLPQMPESCQFVTVTVDHHTPANDDVCEISTQQCYNLLDSKYTVQHNLSTSTDCVQYENVMKPRHMSSAVRWSSEPCLATV